MHGCKSNRFDEIRVFFEKYILDLRLADQLSEIKLINSIRNRLDEIDLLDYHSLIAKRQRESYNYLKENFSDDVIFIELDFKMKIKIGMGPEQYSQEFYNQKTRYCLGKKTIMIIIYCKNLN